MVFRLPDLQNRLPIVDAMGRPVSSFLRYFNVDFKGAIERQEADQAAVLLQLQEVQASQAQTIDDLTAVVEQLQALSEATQQAQVTANDAQTSADAAAGGGAVSGSATDPSVDLPGTGWVLGPQVDLLGVVAGNLTISGSGPIQDNDVGMPAIPSTATCEFRIVEVVGGVDDIIFTGDFRVQSYTDKFGNDLITVSNLSSSSVSAFSSARTSTGAVSYRIDARRLTGGGIFSLLLYVYARRA